MASIRDDIRELHAPELAACSAAGAALLPWVPPASIWAFWPLPPVALENAPPPAAVELTAPLAAAAAPALA